MLTFLYGYSNFRHPNKLSYGIPNFRSNSSLCCPWHPCHRHKAINNLVTLQKYEVYDWCNGLIKYFNIFHFFEYKNLKVILFQRKMGKNISCFTNSYSKNMAQHKIKNETKLLRFWYSRKKHGVLIRTIYQA